jgi:small subunit ribosomal protein S18
MSTQERTYTPRDKREEKSFSPKKKKCCPLSAAGVKEIDYKDIELLKQFITERGKLLPRRVTGVSYYYQKKLRNAILRSRYMALLPFVAID